MAKAMMRIGFVQFKPVFGQVDQNLHSIERLVTGARADLLVLPELCTTGYAFTSKREARELAEPAKGQSIGTLKKIAKNNKTILVVGFAEFDQGKVYNSAALIRPSGKTDIYRKTHLFFHEKKWFAPGNTGLKVYSIGKVRVGLMICFDWIFPEAARTLALKGAQVICHPSNLVLPHCPASMPLRALENRVFTVTANRTGREKRGTQDLRFIGRSVICGPDRQVLASAGTDEECVRVVEIDPARAKDKKITPLNDLFKDRKTRFYRL